MSRMSSSVLCVILLTCLSLSPIRAIPADEKQSTLDTKMEPFRGRWTASRESKEREKIRRYQLVLEFKGAELTFFTEEDGKKANEFTLKVIAVEEGPKESHLVLGFGSSKYVVHYDFEGEKMILVGRLPNRPFEGFSLSGEYNRAQKPK
jgi:hypothetical protein